MLSGSSALHAVVIDLPLLDGYALGIAFLECIVSSGAPSSMHDEFIQLLFEAIRHYDHSYSKDHHDDHTNHHHHTDDHHNQLHLYHHIIQHGITTNNDDLTVYDTDTIAMMMYKIYRKKLQAFLLNSTEYHPQRLLSSLPAHHHYLHELALLSSRLGEHNKVMDIYINKLADIKLAELHCDRIYTLYKSEIDNNNNYIITNASNSSSRRDESVYLSTLQGLNSAGDIYLILFQVS